MKCALLLFGLLPARRAHVVSMSSAELVVQGQQATYLAIDVLFLPEARSRWGTLPLMGVIHGLYYAAFPMSYLAGACILQAAMVVPLAILCTRLSGGVRKILMFATLPASLGCFAKLLFFSPK